MLYQHHCDKLFELHGESFISSSLCDLQLNKHNSKSYRVLIANGFPNLSSMITALQNYVTSTIKQFIDGLAKFPFESLITYGVPNFLESLFKLADQLAQGVYDGIDLFISQVGQLWDFLSTLIFGPDGVTLTKEQKDLFNNLVSQASSFFTALKQYGSSFLSTFSMLFKGIKAVVAQVIRLYENFMQIFGQFTGDYLINLYNTTGMNSLSEKALEIILFVVFGIQDFMDFSIVGVENAQSFCVKYTERIFGETTQLPVPPSLGVVLQKMFIALIDVPGVKQIVSYLRSIPSLFGKIMKMFQFALDVVQKIAITVMEFFSTLVFKCIHQVTEVFIKVAKPYLPDPSTPWDDLQDYISKANKIKTDPNLADGTKKNLEEVISFAKNMQTDAQLFTKEKYQTILEKKGAGLFKGSRLAAQLVTQKYLNKEVDDNLINQVVLDKFGYTADEMRLQFQYVSQRFDRVLSTARQEAQMRKPKVESLIGNNYDQLETIELERLIEELSKELDIAQVELDKARQNSDYKKRIEILKENRSEMLQSIDVLNPNLNVKQLQEQAMKDFLVQKEAVQLEFDILKKKKKRNDLENQLKVAQDLYREKSKKYENIVNWTVMLIVCFGIIWIILKEYLSNASQKVKFDKTISAFKNIEQIAGNDPLLGYEISLFAASRAQEAKKIIQEDKDEAVNVRNLMMEFNTFVNDLFGQIQRGEKDMKQVEDQFGGSIFTSAIQIIERQKEVEKERKEGVGFVIGSGQKIASAASVVYGYLTGTDVAQQKKREKMIETFSTPVALDLMSKINLADIAKGTKNYNGGEEQYRFDIHLILKTHFAAMYPVLVSQVQEAEKPESVFSKIASAATTALNHHFGIFGLQYGEYFDSKKVSEGILSGGMAYIGQVVTIWSLYANVLLITINFVIGILWYMAYLVLAIIYQERATRIDAAQQIGIIVLKTTSQVSAQLIGTTTKIFEQRYGFVLGLLNSVLSGLLPWTKLVAITKAAGGGIKSGWGWVRSRGQSAPALPAPPVKPRRSTRLTKKTKPCIKCDQEAQWQTENEPIRYFCSYACAKKK